MWIRIRRWHSGGRRALFSRPLYFSQVWAQFFAGAYGNQALIPLHAPQEKNGGVREQRGKCEIPWHLFMCQTEKWELSVSPSRLVSCCFSSLKVASRTQYRLPADCPGCHTLINSRHLSVGMFTKPEKTDRMGTCMVHVWSALQKALPLNTLWDYAWLHFLDSDTKSLKKKM